MVQQNEHVVTTVLPPRGETLNTENIEHALAEAELSPRLCLYSPKVVALLTYLKLNDPSFVMSQEVTRILEDSFARKYPSIWGEISMYVDAKRKAAWRNERNGSRDTS